MRSFRTSGFVRAAPGNRRPSRDFLNESEGGADIHRIHLLHLLHSIRRHLIIRLFIVT